MSALVNEVFWPMHRFVAKQFDGHYMRHESFDLHEDVKGPSNRTFGLVLAVVFGLIGLLPLFSGNPVRVWALAVASGLGLMALAASSWLSPFNRIWTQVGIHLHRVVGTLVLAIVFFLLIAPTGLLMRAVGKDPLRLKFDKSAKSYWIDRVPPGPTGESLKNQF